MLGEGDSSFEGDATQATHSALNYTFENLTFVENSVFVVNSENIRLSALSSNSRPASSSSVGVDNLSCNLKLSLNELSDSNNVDQRDKVVDSGPVPMPITDDQSLVSDPPFKTKYSMNHIRTQLKKRMTLCINFQFKEKFW